MSKVKLVGVLNITPDSFSSIGRIIDPKPAINYAKELFARGADTIDIGAEATNPFVQDTVEAKEEWQRLEPVLKILLPESPNLSISIDTRNPETVDRALHLAGDKKFYVNDVTTFINNDLVYLTAKHGLRAILSHSPLEANGKINRIHHDKSLIINSIDQVVTEISKQRDRLVSAGVPIEHIILDPGIGFGKTAQLNHELLNFAERFPKSDVLIGFSQKRFLAIQPNGQPIASVDPNSYKLTDKPNIAAAQTAIRAGAKYLRVHKPEIYSALV